MKDICKKNDPQTVLNKVFGYKNFRKGQKDIIDSILSGKDTLVLMPTGGGKCRLSSYCSYAGSGEYSQVSWCKGRIFKLYIVI